MAKDDEREGRDNAVDGKLILIEWEDSHSIDAWQQIDALEDKALVCRSVGWLMLDGKQVKVIVPHLSIQEEGVPQQGCGIMTIPVKVVTRMVDLQETKRMRNDFSA